MIGHGGLFRVFPSLARQGVVGMSRGSTPRHAQTAGDLGFAVQFNAKLRGISRSSAILASDSSQSNNMKGNPIHSRERPNVINTLLPVI